MGHRSGIYNSRNSFILLNNCYTDYAGKSTIVEILLYYLTREWLGNTYGSTIVEILLYYLTYIRTKNLTVSTIVEILLYYLTRMKHTESGSNLQ